MKYQLINSTGLPLDLEYYHVAIGSMKKRIKFIDRFGKSGVVGVGDNNLSKRNVVITMQKAETSDIDYINEIDSILSYVQDYNAPIYLHDVTLDQRMLLSISSVNVTEDRGLERRIGNVRISAVMVDSVIEKNYTEINENVINGDIISVNNSSYLDTYPVITLSSMSLINEFRITNTSNNEFIHIKTILFIPGRELVIDCNNGTILLIDGASSTLDLSNSIQINSGFLRLSRGDNSLVYEGHVGASVKVAYWERSAY